MRKVGVYHELFPVGILEASHGGDIGWVYVTITSLWWLSGGQTYKGHAQTRLRQMIKLLFGTAIVILGIKR